MSEPVTITDHALICWLELERLVDVARLREIIANALLRATDAAVQLHAENYTVIADGFVFLVRNGNVVTITEDTPHNRVWAQRRQVAG